MGRDSAQHRLPSPRKLESMRPVEPPSWQLPRGVPRGVWQYIESDDIAQHYDQDLHGHSLSRLDQATVQRHRPEQGLVVDLGSGTGRALIPLARQGLRGLAVDLSNQMLSQIQQKVQEERLPIVCLRANLVELDCLADHSADYVLCLFSTLGMIEGHTHRQEVLRHVRRILRPEGKFVLHVHNFWYRLFDAPGRRWLLSSLLSAARRRPTWGDSQFEFRGIRQFYLHAFTWRELRRSLRRAELEIIEQTAVGTAEQGELPYPRLLRHWRASGWIVVCR